MMSSPYQRLGVPDNTGAYDDKGIRSPLKTNESTSRRSLDAGPQRFEMTCRSSQKAQSVMSIKRQEFKQSL